EAQTFVTSLAKKVSDYLIASAITEKAPPVAFVLKLAGLLDWQRQPAEPSNSLSPPYRRKELQFDRLKDLFSSPTTHLRETLGWGDPGFDPTGFFQVASDFYPPESTIDVGVQGGEPYFKAGIQIQRD